MQKRIGRMAYGVLLAGSVWAGTEYRARPGEKVVAGEFFVQFKPGVEASPLVSRHSGRSHTSFRTRYVNRNTNTQVVHFDGPVAAELTAELAADPDVIYVEPVRFITLAATPANDPDIPNQWALPALQAQQAWSLLPGRYLNSSMASASGRLIVAVIDTGADCTHPDFINPGGTGTLTTQGGQFSPNGVAYVATTVSSPACTWMDDVGHGTMTSGIVAEVANNGAGGAGLGYPLEVLVYKALGPTAGGVQGTDADLSSSITAAVNAGASVISMSLASQPDSTSTGYSHTLAQNIEYAWSHNVVVVSAAGNYAAGPPVFPAAYLHSLGIAASDSTGAVAGFSSIGDQVELLAPGVIVYSTIPGGYSYGSGTSFSTPYVSALAGLLAMSTPGTSAAAILLRMEQSAASANVNGGWTSTNGYGLIQASDALSGKSRIASLGSVRGNVTDSLFNALAATVTLNGQTITTDPTIGSIFRFPNLPAGTYPITATVGTTTKSLTVEVVPGADTIFPIVTSASYGTFSGIVTDQGAAVPYATVQAISASGLIQATTYANSTGAYNLWVAAGSYRLRASLIGYATTTTTSTSAVASNGTTAVNLTVAKYPSVSGTVLDSGSKPAVSASVLVASGSTSTVGAATNASGAYQTIGVPPGSGSATASLPGYSDVAVSGLTFQNDQPLVQNFQFPSPTFSIGAADVTSPYAASTTTTINITNLNGFASPVTLSASNWPAGIHGSFATNPTTSTSTLTIAIASTVVPGAYTLTIAGSSGALNASTTFVLTVTASTFPFGVSVAPLQASAMVGVAQNWTMNWASGAGQLPISWGEFLIQDASVTTPTISNACYMYVYASGAVQPTYDDGTTQPVLDFVGVSYAPNVSNSHCQLNGPTSSITAANLNSSLQAVLNLQFSSLWTGKTLSVWLRARDSNYQPGTWQQLGTMTVTAAGPGFTLGATAATVTAGSSGTSTVTVTPVNGFNSSVTLAASSWPSGITGTFGTNPATSSSQVTINVGSGVAAGSYSLAVNGTSGALSASTSIALTVNASGGGGGGTLPYGVSVTPSAGSGVVGVAQNWTMAWASPSGQLPISWGEFLIQDASVATPTISNACYMYVYASGAVQATDDAGSPQSILDFVGTSYAPNVSNSRCQLNGTPSSVTATNLNSNLQAVLNLQFSSLWTGKTLSVWLRARNSNYQPGTWQQLGTITVTAAGPGFTLGATAATVTAGSSGTSNVTVTPVNGFNSSVTLAASSWPSGITGTFGTNPATSSSQVTINVGSGVAAGSYSLAVNGTSGALSASTSIALTVTASGGGGGTLPYGVSVTPSAGSGVVGVAQNWTMAWASPSGQLPISWGEFLIQDASVATPTISNACYMYVYASGAVQATDDAGSPQSILDFVGTSYAPNVSNSRCQLNGTPSSITATNLNSNVQAVLNLQFSSLWTGKTLSVWLRARNSNYQPGTWQQLGTITVTAAGPGFTLGATAATVTAGSSGTSTVTVTPVNGFNSSVTLAASSWPSGITGTFGTNPATSSSQVTINVGSGVAAGSYSLAVNGTSGALSASTSIALTVTASGGGGGGTLPYGVSVTPSAGSGVVGVAQNWTMAWASPSGQLPISWGEFLIQDASVATPTISNACYMYVYASGAVQPTDDTGAPQAVLDFVGTSYAPNVSNSRCQLNGTPSSVTATNLNSNVQAVLNLQFSSLWTGKTLSVWLRARNSNYQPGTWQKLGTITIQ